MNIGTALDLRELIDGTAFPQLREDVDPSAPIDWLAEIDHWLARTAEWRAALVALGMPDEWEPRMLAFRREVQRRAGIA